MLLRVIWLAVIIGHVTSQQDPGTQQQTDNPVDVSLDNETDAAADALARYLGFSCPKGHRCLPVLDCLPCDYGTYKDSEGSDLCKRCPPDCTTLRQGAQSREECVPFCPPGYEISLCGKTCTKCRPGKYKSTWDRSTPCTECPEDSTPSDDIIGMTSVEKCYHEAEDPFPDGTNIMTTAMTVQASHPHTDDCQVPCNVPPSTELNLCSSSVHRYLGCLDRCSTTPKTELWNARSVVHADIGSKFTAFINQGSDWTSIFSLFKQQCPDVLTTAAPPLGLSTVPCHQDADCGVGGRCNNSYCGCLTTNCTGVAYSALPGCRWFCHCNDAIKTWEIQTCNSYEYFDEKINNCNWDYNVVQGICYSNASCETEICTPDIAPDSDFCRIMWLHEKDITTGLRAAVQYKENHFILMGLG